ncbi:integrase catalytic domain-containing protein [Trichonephila clavipes]|nr:integrase catalytic domain-containing protein [Trichonephila clavipes]
MKSPCLKYFNGNKAVTVSVSASRNGLGAVLLQGQPVAYGSVSLTQTQQRYAQIEKELTAVIYGMEHFNYYTYGRIVTVQTDHKPILGTTAEEGKDLYVALLDYRIQPAKDMPSPAELSMGRKVRTFLPSHPGQLKPTFDVERAREALRKKQIIQNKYANKHATVLPVLPKDAKDGGVFRRNRFQIRQDNTENNPRWSRTVDLCNSDATEISRIPNDSADGQINASSKTNRSNINQQFPIPVETFSEQSNTVVRKSSRNIMKPIHYRDN